MSRASKARSAFVQLHRGAFDDREAFSWPYDAAERTLHRQGRYIMQNGALNVGGEGPYQILSRLQRTADRMRQLYDRLSAKA